MDENSTIIESTAPSHLYAHPLAKAFLNKVYAWMALSMLLTAGVAIYSTHNDSWMLWIAEHTLLLCLSTLGIVLFMVFGSRLLTAGAMGVLLLVFAGLEGLLFGPLLTLYTQESLGITFASTAGTFGAMSLYGAVTKRNLAPLGRAMVMMLLGLIVCLIINVFWGNGIFDFILSVVGVVDFSILTAYDTQKILLEGLALEGEARSKGAVMGALTLYLDFINLFLYLLRFLGDRK